MPPSAGPDHGASPLTTSETSSKRTPLAVYSRPLVLTSTDAYPAADAVALHASAASLTYAAGTTVASSRQRSEPDAAAAAEKPPPSTVSGVPPSDAPASGHTDETDTAGRYVNEPPAENCCAFAEIETRRGAANDAGGETHST